ncbi:Rpn family recombination-promoting nuclease/putative transposase [Evansella sp. AB-P1]|uniref:Rpn family recombination-promoting nuclease/putative transposase n=1 Tax=Evansella sp. AB-P1 TaxID=3037653 RepID=UPI00241D8779|nr:Rpn family recombination-promoting nuclease/putative transposase [Evansella sp. AB-P1]MDG5786679.1 Rpn family recombination-promoting nuclease/putative transposase [Evansella sp. AB-P1]
MKRLNPLNDFLFKKLFGDNKDKDILIGLLNAILQYDIVDITLESENLDRDSQENKLGVLDIKAKNRIGEKFNIEVQLLNNKNMVQRTLFYWSKLFVEGFEAGSNYTSLKKTVTINILDFKMEELRKESYHSIYKLRESRSKNELTNLLEIHFVELPKFNELKANLNNSFHRWLIFLKEDVNENTLREVIRMDIILNKAEEKLLNLSADPETRKEYERRAKALSDERSRLEDAKILGILEVAKSLLDSGLSLSEVAKHTPYNAEELEQMLKMYNLS